MCCRFLERKKPTKHQNRVDICAFIHLLFFRNWFILVTHFMFFLLIKSSKDFFMSSSHECALWPCLINLFHIFKISHTDETQKLLKDLAHRKPLQVPNIFHHLPHLLNNEDGLHPAVQVGQGRTGGKHFTTLQRTPSTTVLHFLYVNILTFSTIMAKIIIKMI